MVIARFFQLIKIVINDYYNYMASKNYTSINAIAYLNKPYINELLIIIHDFINNTMNLICEQIFGAINNNLTANVNLNMIIFIVFLIFISLGYLIIWVPFENRLKDDVSVMYLF